MAGQARLGKHTIRPERARGQDFLIVEHDHLDHAPNGDIHVIRAGDLAVQASLAARDILP